MTADRERLRRLAELDAGLPDDATAGRARAEVADPRDREVLDALAATRAELAAIGTPPAPPGAASRWVDALGAAAAARHPPEAAAASPDPTPAGPRRAPTEPAAPVGPPASATPPTVAASRAAVEPAVRPGSAGAGGPPPAPRRRPALVAAAALVALAVTALLRTPPTGREVLVVERVDLAAAATATTGVRDLGPLADPARRTGCLTAAGVGPVAPQAVLGGRPVLLDGTPGTLLLLATGELGRLRVVVVDTGCGPDGGRVLADDVVGLVGG
ncbi:MAG TPA: hypothetical protein VM367_18110 [Pseudonocardia sp.]|nr:hypothetical protein [Pseudonocardia sp.]